MNFIHWTYKFHCPAAPKMRFFIDTSQDFWATRRRSTTLRYPHAAASCYRLESCAHPYCFGEALMPTFPFIEYQDATPEVRAIYDDIMATRKIDWINNFWKAIAHDPVLLKRTWESLKQIMGPGALDPLTKELIYIAVSVTNNCNYCIASHTASAFSKGMTDAMFKELQAVIGMANETNKLVTGYQVEVDQRFQPPLPR
jgi:AhpD family alkylhydroperoxidase